MNDSNPGGRPFEDAARTLTNEAVRRYISDRTPERVKVSFPTVTGDSFPAIRAKGSFPAFASELLDGVDVVCGVSDEHVLAANVLAEQFRGLTIVCPVCGSRNRAPPLTPGQPLNPSRTVVLAERETLVGHSVAVDPFTMWISLADAEAFTTWTGYRKSWRVPRWRPMDEGIDTQTRLRTDRLPPIEELDLTGVATLADLVRRVAQSFPQSLQPSISEMANGSHDAGASGLHPLHIALEKLLEQARTPDAPITTGNPWLTIFLHSAYVFQRWRNHPRYGRLCRRLADPEEFAHNTSQLAIAAVLQDLGNGVTLAPESPNQGNCDLWVAGGPASTVSLEVKARHELRTLSQGLGPDEAARAVREAIDHAGIGQGGQLDPGRPGILGMGAFMLSPTDMETLLRQARIQMRDWQDHATHVAAIFAVSVGFSLESVGQNLTPERGIDLRTLHGFVPNPKYSGSVLLSPLTFEPIVTPLGPSRTVRVP